MILVVVGSSSVPFDRLVSAAGTLGHEEELIVQRGASAVIPAVGRCVDFMPFEEMVDHVKRARVVVTHGGVGTILIALVHGRQPVVVPRLHRHGEAVDDHQLELASRLAEEGLVTLVEDVAALRAAVSAQRGDARRFDGYGSLGRELRGRIREQVGTVE